MPTKILLIEQNEQERQWLTGTLAVAQLGEQLTAVDKITLKSETLLSDINLLIVAEEQFINIAKRLKHLFTLQETPFPILVLTKTFDVFNDENYLALTLDSFPKQSITPQILNHIILSLHRDFEKNNLLKQLAHFDELTNATNRHLFNDRLKQALFRAKRYKEPISLLYFDLDKFKDVNDNYGHEVGDKLLQVFVKTVKEQVRESDTIARMGGDEFALLLPKTNESSAIEIAKNIIRELAKPKQLLKNKIFIQTSIGIAAFSGCESPTVLTSKNMLKAADNAVYQSKSTGRNRYMVFSSNN